MLRDRCPRGPGSSGQPEGHVLINLHLALVMTFQSISYTCNPRHGDFFRSSHSCFSTEMKFPPHASCVRRTPRHPYFVLYYYYYYYLIIILMKAAAATDRQSLAELPPRQPQYRYESNRIVEGISPNENSFHDSRHLLALCPILKWLGRSCH